MKQNKADYNLKPCPFCGRKPIIRKTIRFPRWKAGAIEAYEAVCLNYRCLIYNANEQYFSSEKEAAQVWNSRFNEKEGVNDD